MARKLLTQLRTKVTDDTVHLSAYKSTPAFQARSAQPDPFRTIRVYRREEPDFTFGEDYAEYFDGLSWRDAKVGFEGALPAGNDRVRESARVVLGERTRVRVRPGDLRRTGARGARAVPGRQD